MVSDKTDFIANPQDAHVLDRPRDPDLLALYELWLAKRGTRPVPARGDLDPMEFRRLLPHVILVESQPPPAFYRVRLSGEAINEFYGRSLAGRSPHEYLDAKTADVFVALFRHLTETGQPAFRTGRAYWQRDKSYKRYESCLLPLASDGTTVDMVLAAIKFGS